MPRHFLFGSDTYLGFGAVKPHFLPWIRQVEPQTFQTDHNKRGFTVRIANEMTGDLEVSLQSGSELIIQSRRWKHRIFQYIQAPGLAGGFGGSYLKPLVERFFEHLKDECNCFEPVAPSAPPQPITSTLGVWKRHQ